MTPLSKVFILGAGAQGCAWASLLKLAGIDVHLVLRDQIAKDDFEQFAGLEFRQSDKIHFLPMSALLIEDLPEKVPLLIVTLKSYQLLNTLEKAKSYLPVDTPILLIHNGLGLQEAVMNLFPQTHLVWGLTQMGCYLSEKFKVTLAGVGPTSLGSFKPLPENIKAQVLATMNSTGMPFHWQENLDHKLLEKWIINCGINALTGILGCPNGHLVDFSLPSHLAECNASPTTLDQTQEIKYRPQEIPRKLIEKICLELNQFLATHAPSKDIKAHVQPILEVARATAHNRSSTLQDLEQGRRTEIDYLNDYILRRYPHTGSTTSVAELFPLNFLLTALIHLKELAVKAK